MFIMLFAIEFQLNQSISYVLKKKQWIIECERDPLALADCDCDGCTLELGT